MHEESLARHWHEDDVWHAPFSAMDVHDVDSDMSIGEDVRYIETAPSASTTAAIDSAAPRHDERSSLARGRRAVVSRITWTIVKIAWGVLAAKDF